MPSISIENYLKALFHLERTSERVTTSALAAHLDVSQPSATKMMKSLASSGLVEHVPYQGASLTDAGRKSALRVIRNHRLIEVFLVDVLGYTWDEVHDEAERLEHAISDSLADRIDAYLGFPATDPHGDPIPTSDGELRRHVAVTLADLEDGTSAEVLRVLEQGNEVLRYLAGIGLRPGAQLTVLEALPFEGPIRVTVGGKETPLGRPIARRVLVSPK